LVEARTAAQPGALAVVCGADRCSYAELGARANALAWRLRGEGVTPEQPVAVCVERSLASVVALLAVMKAGGVYVPLDPSYPDERLGQILADVRPRVLVASPSHAHRLRAVVEIAPDGRIGDAPRTDDPPAVTGPEHLAYAIHTSGSTGRPKGVLLEHGGLVNLVLGKIDRFAVRADSRVLQFVSFGFGVSVADVLMTLAAGATLVVRGPEALAGPALARLLQEQAITNLVVPASVLASLPGAELPALRAIAVGGEPCPADLVARWAPKRHFVQAYGPTEATVCATTAQCVPDERRPSVGRPLPNVDVVIADGRLRPVPPGVPGELLIGGAGLARGYLDRPDLTAERFVPNPFGTAGERLYRTGDLARMRPDGSVELLGRADDQVQLRGIRIELGDIEAALRAHPAVAEAAAAVHAHPVAGDQLVGYVIAASPLPELRGFLRERLPDGLVPAVVVALDALPRTTSGKLDRRALPAPPAPAAGSRAPETATELLLAELWTELLRPAAAIGADDDFFALGGQSLLAAQLAARVRDCFEIELPTRAVFDDPTIAALAERVETAILADLKELQWS
jgi:amino acid adenylation domain-containing protein